MIDVSSIQIKNFVGKLIPVFLSSRRYWKRHGTRPRRVEKIWKITEAALSFQGRHTGLGQRRRSCCAWGSRRRPVQAGPFARKLRAAVDESGCRSLAEFVMRVRAAAPDTSVTLDRAYKWLQGKALPQDVGVYDDLAVAIGLQDEGAFVRESTVEAFTERMRKLRLGASPPCGPAGFDPVVQSGLRDGAYAMYSLSRDLAASDTVVRGCVHVAGDPAGIRRIEYVERDGAERVSFGGELTVARRLHTVAFAPSPRGQSLSLALAVPGQPVPVVGGLLIGEAQYAVAARPICCRVLLLAVRNPAADPEAGNGEFGTGPERIAGDVAAIGYAGSDCAAVAARILDYLTAPSGGQIDVSHQAIEAISLMVALVNPLPGAA